MSSTTASNDPTPACERNAIAEWLLCGLLVVACMTLILVAMDSVPRQVCSALVVGQLMATAVWGTMRRGFASILVVTIASVPAGNAIFIASGQKSWAAHIVLALLLSAQVYLLGKLLSNWRPHLLPNVSRSRSDAKWQFSIGRIMLVTVAVALLSALAKWAMLDSDDAWYLISFTAVAAITTVFTAMLVLAKEIAFSTRIVGLILESLAIFLMMPFLQEPEVLYVALGELLVLLVILAIIRNVTTRTVEPADNKPNFYWKKSFNESLQFRPVQPSVARTGK